MPQTIILTGWVEGFRKVRLTKLIQGSTDLGLKAAKGLTDALLMGEEVRVENVRGAGAFLASASQTGAVGHVEGQLTLIPGGNV